MYNKIPDDKNTFLITYSEQITSEVIVLANGTYLQSWVPQSGTQICLMACPRSWQRAWAQSSRTQPILTWDIKSTSAASLWAFSSIIMGNHSLLILMSVTQAVEMDVKI